MTEETKPAPVFPAKLDDAIEQFVRLRDALKLSDEKHKEKTKPAREYIDGLGQHLLALLDATGQNSAATNAGTAYKTVKKSATLADAALFREFIISTNQYDLADIRANAPAIAKWIDEVGNGELPPGVNYSTHVVIGVRRPGEK